MERVALALHARTPQSRCLIHGSETLLTEQDKSTTRPIPELPSIGISENGAMSAEPQYTCPSCGNEFFGAVEFCPVCMLRKALAGGIKSGESSSEDAVKPTQERTLARFEHYELVTGEDGRPLELGRGAMGVTYKAFDMDLQCPVTLKVISERYLSDESARARFLREARAAASVRHPNVASVFHLGRTGQNYFYAMEFVEGKRLRISFVAQADLT
jgi:Protein kinase domain